MCSDTNLVITYGHKKDKNAEIEEHVGDARRRPRGAARVKV